jgi:3-methyladenine DNA glycosylase AlkC
MAEAFKLLLGEPVVRALGQHLQRAWKPFPRERFEAQALDGLDALELKARALHIAAALSQALPKSFEQAARVMEAALAPVEDPRSETLPRSSEAGLAGWAVWPLTVVVMQQGLAHPDRALEALHAMTQRFTAEWAVRPFLLTHPALAFATLERWTQDRSVHVRRLASEGSRPRLPWGEQLRPLIVDPSPTAPLLEALQDDPSAYVRRSVANHLNDIGKDHPALLLAWLQRHVPGASAPRRLLLRHASRSLIKQGHPGVLAVWGLGQPLKGEATLALSAAALALGDSLQLDVLLRSRARQAQVLEVDYRVHHVKADGRAAPKVFKGWKLTLAPGEERRLRKRHAVKPITTRRYHAGWHAVELQVNGRVVAEAGFELLLD